MGNYKVRSGAASYVGTITPHALAATDTLKILQAITPHLTTAQSMIDMVTNSDYVVPSGKTFNAVEFQLITYLTGSTSAYDVHEGDTADAQTTQKTPTMIAIDVNESANHIPVNFTIAESKYVTIKAATTSIIRRLYLLGYET